MTDLTADKRSERFKNYALGIAAAMSSVLIPLAGLALADQQKRADTAAQYVKLAVDIVDKPPGPDGKPDPIRGWAIETLNHYSSVKFSSAANISLAEKPIQIQEVKIPIATPCLTADTRQKLFKVRPPTLNGEDYEGKREELIRDLGLRYLQITTYADSLESMIRVCSK